MKLTTSWASASAGLLFAIGLARAQTSYPMISRVEPTAIQRGHSAELTIAGAGDFSGASAVLVEGSGVSGEIVAPANPGTSEPPAKGARRGGSTRIRLAAAGDAATGVRELRVVTPQGVSSIGLAIVTDDPVLAEADEKANNTAAGAQKLGLPVVVSGKIGVVEDVDWYAIEVDAGQTVAFSLWGNRLENKIHDLQMHLDPILILHDAAGRELAADDNHDFADPRLVHTFKDKGVYYIQVRDSNYGGNANWTYVLHATSRPFVSSVFPMAVNPGKTSEVYGQGANFDPARPLTVAVSADAPPGPRWDTLQSDRGPTLPHPVVVTALSIVAEVGDAGGELAKAQPVVLPAAVCGKLGDRNDQDAYRFEAKKGQAFAFESVARRAGAAADPVLRVLDAKGNTAIEVDDTPGMGKDNRLEWTAPADGSYAIQVADLHSRGGPDFGYVILADHAKPDFVATCDPDKVNIGPGARTTIFVKVARRSGFSGPVAVSVDGLPPGVSASPLTIPASMTQGVVVVSAAASAKAGGSIISMQASSPGGDPLPPRRVAPMQEIYMPGGGRGLYPAATLALAITKPSDITLESRQAEVVLRPGEAAPIDVTVARSGDYGRPVSLAVTLAHLNQVFASPLPPGVTIREKGSKTLLGPKETAGTIVIQAAADAPPCEKVPIAVMGHVSINFVVKTAYSTGPILITIPPAERK